MFHVPPNPLIERYTARGAHQIMRRGITVAGVVGGIGLIASLLCGLSQFPFCSVPWFVVLPPTLAVLSTIVTSRHLTSEQYQLLQLTPLDRSDILKSFLFICFYRLSALWILAVAVIGPIAGIAAYILAGFAPFGVGAVIYPEFAALNILKTLFLVPGIMVSLLGIVGVAVVCGVTLALWWRKPIEAAIVSAVGVLALMVVIALPLILIQQMSPEGEYYALMFLATIFTALLPLAIAWGLLRLAQRQVGPASRE
jgi:MFS family permease